MKNSSFLSNPGNLFPALILILLTFSFQACTKKMTFAISSVVPAAEGKVKVKKDKNENYKIDLDVSNLADPSRLDPPKAIYVVWMHSEDNQTMNIGQLKNSNPLLSKSLRSSLNTVTSFKPRDFFITAEDNGDLQYPSRQLVLKTTNYR